MFDELPNGAIFVLREGGVRYAKVGRRHAITRSNGPGEFEQNDFSPETTVYEIKGISVGTNRWWKSV